MAEYERDRSQACEDGSPDDEADSNRPVVEVVMPIARVALGESSGLSSVSDASAFLST
jgi:hypothetical protein